MIFDYASLTSLRTSLYFNVNTDSIHIHIGFTILTQTSFMTFDCISLAS